MAKPALNNICNIGQRKIIWRDASVVLNFNGAVYF